MSNQNPTVLKATRVTKNYQMGQVQVQALKEVDFSVRRGEFVAIMGPSGSGKSTLLHLLGGLDTPSSGEIVLAGQQLSELTDDQITLVRRKKVGFVFQFYNLLPTLSAGENVALPLIIDGQNGLESRSRVNELLDLVGLEDRADHRPDQLSGGQQQRVAIARAFINRPEIVLADEPTGNLDSKSGNGILKLLRRTCREMQATIVMVTHDARAASYADRIVFLKDGRCVHEITENRNGIPVHRIVQKMEELEL
jgi:putative ABC transport system ATP-binding protein